MATKTVKPKPEMLKTAFLEELAKLDVRSIEPETARKLLQFKFAGAHHKLVKSLSEKAQSGTLTPAEQSDLDEYIRVGTLLGILQSRARRVLRKAGQAL